MKIVSSILFAAIAAVSLSASALTTADMAGTAVHADSTVQRTIAVDSNTHYINMHQGDVVKLTDGNDSVNGQFDGVNSTFPLSKVFPAAPNAKNVKVYVQIDPVG